MENYRNGPHSRYDLKYHFVWVAKYRKPVLVGEVGLRLRELVREVCLSLCLIVLPALTCNGTFENCSGTAQAVR